MNDPFAGLQIVYPGDYYQTTRKWTLTRRAVAILGVMRVVMKEQRPYGEDEIRELLEAKGLKLAKFAKFSLQEALHNLWRCGKIVKLCRGFRGTRDGKKPLGVKWYVET